MNAFTVTITVNDCCCSKCCSTNRETTKIITNSIQFIQLQNCYHLRVLGVTSNYALLEITNNSIHYIRKAFLNIPINLRLNENCPTHSITITVSNIVIQ